MTTTRESPNTPEQYNIQIQVKTLTEQLLQRIRARMEDAQTKLNEATAEKLAGITDQAHEILEQNPSLWTKDTLTKLNVLLQSAGNTWHYARAPRWYDHGLGQ